MSTVIKVESLSKQYRLGQVGTGSMAHDLNRFWHRMRGKEDPYLKIGEENDHSVKGNSDYVWALKDINFEVKHGDVLGIIGRNGAGKSTLLKILSRTTTPTAGTVKIKGRVASLLEVGTGFHPELSGRDNIYLNGAILGMTKHEIKSKFDEIVEFSGIERYIDTPVKRYSSGMYVRLAFGVAAHLEPEILIVDEVLAVGDAEFQKKALGKMQDVSNREGCTVLFVSHNIAAINNLCNNAILLSNGKLDLKAETNEVINKYFEGVNSETRSEYVKTSADNRSLYFKKINLTDDTGSITSVFEMKEIININFEIINKETASFQIGLAICDKFERRVMIDIFNYEKNKGDKELIQVHAQLPVAILTPGIYKLQFSLFTHHEFKEYISDVIEFEILKENTKYETISYDYGVINKEVIWS